MQTLIGSNTKNIFFGILLVAFGYNLGWIHRHYSDGDISLFMLRRSSYVETETLPEPYDQTPLSCETKNDDTNSQNSSINPLLQNASLNFKLCPEKQIRVQRNKLPWKTLILDPSCADKYRSIIAQHTTLLININKIKPGLKVSIRQMIININKTYPNIWIKVGVKPGQSLGVISKYVQSVQTSQSASAGEVWNKLIEKSRTKFVLVAHHIVNLDSDINLERLFREMYHLATPIIGGAVKDASNGYWHHGCRQLAFRNYVLVYQTGYKQSIHDCIVCDSISGPFLARRNYLRLNPLPLDMPERLLFEDYFLFRASHKFKTFVCPDSMFNVHHDQVKDLAREEWLALVAKWRVNRLVIKEYGEQTAHEYTCKEAQLKDPSASPGKPNAPCHLKKLINHIKFVMKMCADNNIECDAVAGTMIGAVKFNGVLPWDRDADIHFLGTNFSAMARLRTQFEQAGYSLVTVYRPGDSGNFWGAYESFGSDWKVEIYAKEWTHSGEEVAKGNLPTKVNFHGVWINGEARNVGHEMRQVYKPEVYKHVERGASGNYYGRCPTPGAQDCLDKFSTDGNFDFINDPVP